MHVSFIPGAAICFAAVLLMGPTATAQKGVGQGPTLEELVARLQDDNHGVRQKTLGYIGAMKPHPNEIAPHVIRLLKDPHYHVRADAANSLGNLQNALPDLGTRFPECVPQLIRMLSDRDPDDKYQLVRRSAAYALRHLGASSQAAVQDLVKIAVNKNENAALRTEAVQALGDIGHASPEVVAALTKLLDDPTRISATYPTVGNTASSSLGRFKAQAEARRVLIDRLKLKDDSQRANAATALAAAGFGSPEAEIALLELLDDKNAVVQKAALSSLEGINGTYAFFFRYNVTSRVIDEKRQALLKEIRDDADRKAPFAKILAAKLRLGEGHHPWRADALEMLVALDARDYVPMLKEQFAKLEKKTVYLERRDLRMQLVIALAAWLPDKEAAPFLIGVDTDADEAPMVRFRAVVLLCERGDKPAVAHIVKEHLTGATKVKATISIEALKTSLQDRQWFHTDKEFDALKAVAPDGLAEIQTGIRLAQHVYGLQRREGIRDLSLTKVRVHDGKIESLHFRLSVPLEEWSFELRKKGDYWLPCRFRMDAIQ